MTGINGDTICRNPMDSLSTGMSKYSCMWKYCGLITANVSGYDNRGEVRSIFMLRVKGMWY